MKGNPALPGGPLTSKPDQDATLPAPAPCRPFPPSKGQKGPTMGSCYLRAGAWLDTLRRLHALGLSDPRIALELSQIHDPLAWDRHKVRYWRRQSGPLDPVTGNPTPLPPNPPAVDGYLSIGEARALAWRRHQVKAGWGHLLPAWEASLRDDLEAGRWLPGHELSPFRVSLLSALLALGPATRRALAPPGAGAHWGKKALRRLVVAGLVARGRRWLYRLTEAATRGMPTRRRLPAGADRRMMLLKRLARGRGPVLSPDSA